MGPFKRCVLAGVLCAVSAAALLAQGREYIQSHYNKNEYLVPMRDGRRLFTAVYAPKDTSKSYPILITRTPYGSGPYGPENFPETLGPSPAFATEGYIIVSQDVRGRNSSEGEFVNIRPYIPDKRGPQDVDESSDAYDTVAWLLKNVSHNNGRAGFWGISYPGFYAAMAAIDAHPAVKAVSPQAPVAEWFIGDDFHHQGAFFLTPAFNFLVDFGRPGQPRFSHGTPDGYEFFLRMGPLAEAERKYFKGAVPFWSELMQHGTYDDFWKARAVPPRLTNIKPAVMTVGGWFDAEDEYGALHVYEAIERQNPGAYNILVMGPWFHGAWARDEGEALGSVRFDSKTSLFYRDKIELPFFDHFLKDKDDPRLPEAYVFQTGANQWKREDSWPPKTVTQRTLYLQPGGRLSFEPPPAGAAFDEYISDPEKPVPFTNRITTSMPIDYMVEDQRFAARRTDVLVYQTQALDADITLAGPVTASLQVSTTGTDSDWVVKLIDVYPDNYPDPQPNAGGVRLGGFEQLLRGEPMRGKFRNSFERPEPFEPGAVTKVEFVAPDVLHTFRRGHRIMLQVQSSWFPLVDRNPQKFVDIYKATETDFQKATQRVYHGAAHPSGLKINVLK